MSSQFQWEVLAWEKVLPNIWLKLASVILGKTQFDGCFPAEAKILCSFSRLFWRNASGEDYCSEDPGGFYQGALSPLTCFFCLWDHRLLQYTQLRARYSNTFFLSKKYWNSSDTPVLLPVVAKMTWDFVTTSWEIWGGEEFEDCCFCVSKFFVLVNIVLTRCSCDFSSTFGETCLWCGLLCACARSWSILLVLWSWYFLLGIGREWGLFVC